jgi:serine protease Do
MAIGSPFGLAQTVTTGVISAKGRSNVGISDYEDFLQTDAAINPGNSGGPLINMRGEVIGMNSAIETRVGQSAGVGFAIPVNMIKAMLPKLLRGEQITRGVMGVMIQDVTKDLARQFHLPEARGALISQVSRDSPAERAGLKAGDVIVRYGGKDVVDANQLRNLVAATAPGTGVKVGVIRDGKDENFDVTIGKMSAEQAVPETAPSGGEESQLARLGISMQTLTPDLARRFRVEERKGVLIVGVDPNGIAAAYGVRPGDVIVEADRKPVATVAELEKILSADQDEVLLLIKRRTGSVFLVLKFR